MHTKSDFTLTNAIAHAQAVELAMEVNMLNQDVTSNQYYVIFVTSEVKVCKSKSNKCLCRQQQTNPPSHTRHL